MKKLLIIGAGIGQINLVKKAKELGCHVTVVTIPGNWPALELADDVWYIDIYDRDKIVERAKHENISAVTSDQNDLMMPTVAYVAEKLGLPGNTFEQVNSYCNKNTFRKNCDLIGVPSPKHIEVNDINFDFSSFDCKMPWIVKPADSQSSIGVRRVDSINEVKPALKDAIMSSRTHSAIVEEFFFGKELVCEGFIENGKYFNLGFADRKYFNLDNLMIPSQTLFPSIIEDKIKEKIINYESRMAAYIKPSFCITHSEYLYNELTGEIRIIETALRGGGVFISSHLIPYSTGIDINDILLKKVLGIYVDVYGQFMNKKSLAAGYVCFYLEDGIIDSIEGIEKIKSMPFVKMMKISDIQPGLKANKITYKGDRRGPFIVCGNTRKELENNILKIQNTFCVSIKNKDIVCSGIIWT